MLDRSRAGHIHDGHRAMRRHFDKWANLPTFSEVGCSSRKGKIWIGRIRDPRRSFSLLAGWILGRDLARIGMRRKNGERRCASILA